MKKVKTTLWYVNKAYMIPLFNITKAHIVDDDCNEYIATIKASTLFRDYYRPSDLDIIDLEPYNREYFQKLEFELEYAVKINKI